MDQEFKFRKLRADEIDVRLASMNKGGISVLLYKDARADMNILDETVGPAFWKRRHTRDNANCVVSIYNEKIKEWVEKEDVGKESYAEKEKGLASDSFKRACVNWGIGRELYTAPNLFFFKKDLGDYYSYDENSKKGSCSLNFKVLNISYVEDNISSVEIAGYQYGKEVIRRTFTNDVNTNAQDTRTSQTSQTTKKESTPPVTASSTPPAPAAPPADNNASLKDDDVILMGNCRGRKYGEVKNTPEWSSFLSWAKTAGTKYTGETAEQFEIIKKLAAS